MSAPAAHGRVLPTLNEDGSRNWLRPKPAAGRWWRRRRTVAYALMVLFLALPHLTVNGMPAVLLDLPRREFTILGTIFLPTDTLLLMLLLASCLIAIIVFSALFGRVWCGWACPQTVYMEWVFRPLERWIEGGRSGSLGIDRRHAYVHPRRLVKYAVYAAISLVLAHTFLAYFVGVAAIEQWVRLSPYEHPVPFVVMAVTTGLVFHDFTFFREQTCVIACPYGRMQSALLDRQSLVVAYDRARGEPRAHAESARTHRPANAGDCIACNACVTTCPTGIDIRNGLQMECIHCTQCMDACDQIMARVGKPPGLIRYSSQAILAGEPRHLLRLRVVLYPLAFAIAFGGFLYALSTRSHADVTLLRGTAAPFTVEPDGRVANQVRVKIANRSRRERSYAITVVGAEGGQVIAPESPLTVKAGEQRTTSVFVLLPRTAFINGRRDVQVSISDGDDFAGTFAFNLLGPAGDGGGR
ncbi:MAG: cytochrome c oxidase accessory protein CcoG [Gemmatimonadetes bacterium]|nr:cytochrome c oxidase accessory protein CcoG [Gemmatimonadota bacterium]